MKNKKLRILLTVVLTTFLGFSSSSCSNPSSSDTVNDLSVGSKVDARYVLGFLPKFAAGMKYTYISKSKKGQVEMSELLTLEVLQSSGDLSQVKISNGITSNIVPVDLSKPPVLPPSGISYEGKEVISVPAGSFNSTKISFSNPGGSSFNAWLTKDTGIIKVIEQKNNSDTVTTELKEFKK